MIGQMKRNCHKCRKAVDELLPYIERRGVIIDMCVLCYKERQKVMLQLYMPQFIRERRQHQATA